MRKLSKLHGLLSDSENIPCGPKLASFLSQHPHLDKLLQLFEINRYWHGWRHSKNKIKISKTREVYLQVGVVWNAQILQAWGSEVNVLKLLQSQEIDRTKNNSRGTEETYYVCQFYY